MLSVCTALAGERFFFFVLVASKHIALNEEKKTNHFAMNLDLYLSSENESNVFLHLSSKEDVLILCTSHFDDIFVQVVYEFGKLIKTKAEPNWNCMSNYRHISRHIH